MALRETPLFVIQGGNHVRLLLTNAMPLLILPLAIALVVTVIQSDAGISSSRPALLLITLWPDSKANHLKFRAAAVLHEQFVARFVDAELVINVTLRVLCVIVPALGKREIRFLR